MRPLPPSSYLHECFSYDPETGTLIWRRRPAEHFKSAGRQKRWNEDHASKSAGTGHNRGYRQISIEDQLWLAHRIIWKMMTGNEPPKTIDHKDMDRANDRWSNLRAATYSEQNWNSRIQANSTTGRRGVSKARKKYRAYVSIDGKQKWIGSFDTIEEAGEARDIAAREVAGEFFR